jgi:HEAT repeat protein
LTEFTGDRRDERGASMGVFTVDPALTVRAWDGWLVAATGVAAADAHGRALQDLVPSIAARGLIDRFTAVLETGQVQVLAPAFHGYLIPCEPPTPSPHFSFMQQRVTLGPLRDGDRIVGVMATIEDVTARLDAERALAAALRGEDAGARETAARQLAEAERLEHPEALTGALRDDSWRVRRLAVQGLARHANPDLVASVLTALRHEHRDFNVLSSALQLLAASDMDVTASLAELLHEPDADLRIQAALALGEQGDPAAVSALLAALADEDLNVRFHAIEALGRLRAAEAVDALADVAASGDFFLAFPAMAALAAIGDSRVTPRLMPLLRLPDLRDAAADALGELGDAGVVPPLVHALNDGDSALPVIRALARLHDRYEARFGAGAVVMEAFQHALLPAGAQRILDVIATVRADDARALVLVLGWLRGAAVERALTRLLGRPEVRAEAVEAIVRQGRGIVDLLIEQLAGADDDTRIAAVHALGRIGDSRAAPALADALHGDRLLAVAAAGALAAIGDAAAFEPLLALIGHPDVLVRQAVIGALNSVGHPGMAARVGELIDSPDAPTRESAVRIAGYFGYPACLEALLDRCADPDEGVRRAAIEQLPLLDGERAVERLTQALRHDTARGRAAAAQALGSVEHEAAVGLLIEACGDEDAWVRYFAARALGRHGGVDALARLAALAAADGAMPVRLAAIESIGTLAAPEALAPLVSLARAEEQEIADAALLAIGKIPGDEPVDLLIEALRSALPARRLAAVRGLAHLATTARIEALSWTSTADADEAVAGAALDGLAHQAAARDESADAAIDALIGMTADSRRRESAVAGLARVRHRVARVAAGLNAAQPDVRRATVEALSRVSDTDASAALRHALDDPDASVRQSAIGALDRIGARGVAAVFAVMARQDPSRAVRRAAAAALGRDPGAAPDASGEP